MPTYDYKCPECGKRFEDYLPMSDPETECPVCGAKAERLISPGAGFLFKGSGFYITDYRSSEYKKRAAADKQNPETKKPENNKKTEKAAV